MRHTPRIAGIALAVMAASAGLVLADPASAAPASPYVTDGHGHLRSCAAAQHAASCHALVALGSGAATQAAAPAAVDPGAAPAAAAPAANALRPADLQAAYNLPSATAGSGQTVAIVDAYNDPNAEADLAVYRSQFGLPPCTTANGCFRKVNQNGGTSYPRNNGGWAQEISLDLDMVSAICPNCHILLVEASSASFANLGAAENRAAALGANAISNSYGGSDASDASFGSYYNHPGIAITVSSGDAGFGVEYPASSRYVTAVGGTSLSRSGSTARGWTETAWSDAGSGCSSFNTALSGQASFGTGCTRRAVADVSAVADPNTGVAVYDSYAYQGLSGWLVFGGTSVSAPVIAGVYALAGNAAGIDNTFPYAHAGSLFDVISGSNGSCSPSQLCTARTGWDGPTGLGTPNGTGAF